MVENTKGSTASVIKTGFSWAGFFKDAGLPASVCANYAVLFIDNRMKKSMLPDLNKEILHELGIRAIGDIISILRQVDIVCKNVSSTKTENRELKDSEQPASEKESITEDSVGYQTKQNSTKENHRKSLSKNDGRGDSGSRKLGLLKRKERDDNRTTSDSTRKISLVNKSHNCEDDSAKEGIGRKSRKHPTRKISEPRDSGCDSNSASDDEPIKAKRKRMVVLEQKTIVKSRHRANDSPSYDRHHQKEKPRKSFEKVPDARKSRQFMRHGRPDSLNSSSGDENISKLSRLNYLAQKWKSDEASKSESIKGAQIRLETEVQRSSHQTVKFIFPQQQSVQLKFEQHRTCDDRFDVRERSQKRTRDKVIRAALIEGRRKLDKTRLDNGLHYLGSFKTDIEDEVKPGTLVSDQRDVKVLNRLGSKKEKSEEPEPSKGSLTILDKEGGRITTSLSRQDRTVVNLTKSDNSVFKRLGPEQKVPTNPLSMGVLGTQSKQTVQKPERDRSSSPEHEVSSLSQLKPTFKMQSHGKLPSRTDLRDVINCKGGFIPASDDEESPLSRPVSARLSRKEDSWAGPDLRNRLSNHGHVQKHCTIDGRIMKLTTPKKSRSHETRDSFIDIVMKKVIDSRNEKQKWPF